MTTYYKATRLDGTSRRGVTWKVGEVTTHPTSGEMVRNDPGTYLSLSVEPGETLIGGEYPCRLFEVEPVGDVETSDDYPHKRCALGARVVRELPGYLALGPNGQLVAALLERVRRMTSDELNHAAAAWVATWDATWGAARGAAGDATWDATWDAARALVVRDLITVEQVDALTGPLFSVIGTDWMESDR